MYSERKLRYDRSTIYKIILCVLFVISALLFSDKVMARQVRYKKMYLMFCQ